MDDPTVYLNGEFLPLSQAKVSVLDRGFLFGDGIYEVLFYHRGKPIAAADHIARLKHSLNEVGIAYPQEDLLAISNELVAKQQLTDAKVYWQITRGAEAVRYHIPKPDTKPTVFVMAEYEKPVDIDAGPAAVKTITLPDLRWHRCDIKSLLLLPNCMAKMQAKQAGCAEAILHRDEVVTEGTSTSLLIVKDGKLVTHPANHWILGGITRLNLIAIAKEHGIEVCEQTFTVQDMMAADEVMLGGTTTLVAGVTHVDNTPINDGKVGPITRQLFQWYFA
ncbi:MAG: D-amino acid aminotransferase [Phycisphaeraceae bacterium JB051]